MGERREMHDAIGANPATTRASVAASRMSTAKRTTAGGNSTWSIASAPTACPAAASRPTSLRPTKPVAPVTRMRRLTGSDSGAGGFLGRQPRATFARGAGASS